jgi:uncharacterized protein YjbI with pentapeptide repeats
MKFDLLKLRVLLFVRKTLDKDYEIDMSGVNFEGVNLSGLNLWCVNFSGANFTDANLSDTYFLWSKCDGANFTRADFSRADLSWAHFNEGIFEDATLRWATIRDSYVLGANFTNADFEWSSLVDIEHLLGAIEFSEAKNMMAFPRIGSRDATLYAVKSGDKVVLFTGCFAGNLAQFKEAVRTKHSIQSVHYEEYQEAIKKVEQEMLGK